LHIDDDKRITAHQLNRGWLGATHFQISLRFCGNASIMRAATEGESDRLLGAEANQRLARGLKINLSFSSSEMAAKIRISGIS